MGGEFEGVGSEGRRRGVVCGASKSGHYASCTSVGGSGRSVNLHLTLFAVPTNGVYPCLLPIYPLSPSICVCV